MFSQITFPNPAVDFLYHRSANMVDSTLYDHYKEDDTLHTEEWKLIYEEMYYASHDTNTQLPIDSLINEINQYEKDTVNFGIMHWNLYHLKKASLHTGNYFVFDTTNNKIYDHPSPIASPYVLDSLFVAAPLSSSVYFKNMTYRIDPSLVFRDGITKADLKNNYTLQIDFGDGIGFRVINPDVESFIPVTYATSGEKVIRTVLYPKNGIRSCKYSSISRVYVASDDIKPVADYVIRNIPGMKVGVYNSCQPANESKKIIYVEGFDFMDFIPSGNTTHAEQYSKIRTEQLHHLQNYGYEYYVVDWKDSKQDMRFNAYNLYILIERLKQNQENDENDQEFVIIGESMGGVISRYVINFMESSHYQNEDFYEVFFTEVNDPDSWVKFLSKPSYALEWQNYINNKDRKHNTRLLITLDSPHQGANMPLAYQHMYRLVESKLLPLSAIQRLPNFKFQLLDRKATRQLLKNWAPPFFIIPTYSTSSYTNEPSFDSFFEQSKFENNGNPEFCKMVALSDGALDGTPQQNLYTNANRVDGDNLLNLDYSLDFSFLWVRTRLIDYDLDMNTTPNQTFGKLYSSKTYINFYVVKLVLFGINVSSTPFIHLNYKNATNTTSYDNVAGGFVDLNDLTGRINSTLNYTYDYLNGLRSTYSNATVTSDGMSFCFVPLESALDYNSQDPSVNTNIMGATIANKLSLTPFDVFTGQINTTVIGWKNFNHVNVRNPEVYNLTQQPAAGATTFDDQFAYWTCANVSNHNPIRTFLSQEMGDEEWHLENFKTDRITSYRPEWNMYVNQRNPYYEYNGFSASLLLTPQIYSKKENFDVVGSGYATFYYDVNSPFTSTMNPNISGLSGLTNFTTSNLPYGVCCATSRSSVGNSKIITKATAEAKLEIYPNPSLKQNLVYLKADLPQGGNGVIVTIYDLMGKQVYLLESSKIKDTHKFEQPLNLPRLNLTKGMYLIKVSNDKHSISQQLIIL